eukprot:COSAG01_NODE_82722_length_103_cov_86.250000_1_plen_23_part_01
MIRRITDFYLDRSHLMLSRESRR